MTVNFFVDGDIPQKWTVHAATSQLTRLFTNIMTLLPSFTLHDLRVVSTEHLQRVMHAIREHLPFQIPGSDLFWGFDYAAIVETIFPNLSCLLRLFTLNTPRYFLNCGEKDVLLG